MCRYRIVRDVRSLALASFIGLAGCGNTVESEPVVAAPSPPAKAMLMDVANSGELGSGASLIRDSLTELQKTDSATADPLLKELDELEGLEDAAKIKAKAKAMADKL